MNTLFNKVFAGCNMEFLTDPVFMEWYSRGLSWSSAGKPDTLTNIIRTYRKRLTLLDQNRTVTSISDGDFLKLKEKCKALNIEVIEDIDENIKRSFPI